MPISLRPVPDAAGPLPPRRNVWLRGLNVLGVGALVTSVLSLGFHHPWWPALVYSQCITLGCWIFIDGSRVMAARWVHRRGPDGRPVHAMSDEHAARADWPGWGWMLPCLMFGTVAGVMLGSMLAQWLLGHGPRGAGTSAREGLSLLMISLVPGAAATYFFWSHGRLQAFQARAEVAQRQAAETRLKLLESQLEPHMLFNTLANLRVLIGLDPQRAQAMLDQLIAFLRATLNASRSSSQPLALEFSRVADYLALMKVRMGERLREELLLPAHLAQHPVPPLLLQPLVENAIKHGLEPHVAGGRLQVSAALEGGQLVLRVRDTGAGLAAASSPAAPADSGTGFGLGQVRERLATLYGDAASLTLVPANDAEGGSLVTVRLPVSEVIGSAAAANITRPGTGP
jgi:Histidine kinase/Histidine kinase-, DNA gyrase B-, and HSP90-like ATPase